MSDPVTNNTPVAIEALRQQMGQVMGTLDEIKQTLGQLVQIDRSVAELIIHKDSARRDITLLWERHDEGKTRDDELKDKIGDVKRDHEAFVNTFNGGMKVFLAIIGIFQATMLGGVIWVFSQVNDGITVNRLQEQRIQSLESQLRERK